MDDKLNTLIQISNDDIMLTSYYTYPPFHPPAWAFEHAIDQIEKKLVLIEDMLSREYFGNELIEQFRRTLVANLLNLKNLLKRQEKQPA